MRNDVGVFPLRSRTKCGSLDSSPYYGVVPAYPPLAPKKKKKDTTRNGDADEQKGKGEIAPGFAPPPKKYLSPKKPFHENILAGVRRLTIFW